MRFSHVFLSGLLKHASTLIGLSLLFLLPLSNAADDLVIPSEPGVLSDHQPKSPGSIPVSTDETTEHKLKALELQMDAMQREYSSQMRKLQETITVLSAQISKMSGGSAQPAGLVDKPVDPDDQDIGETLIFSGDDADTVSPAAVPQGGILSGGIGIGGRSILNTATQPFNTSFGSLGQSMNPDIMVTGDFVGNYANRKNMTGRNRFSVRETEFGFSAAIDPYTKGTFVFSKPEDESLELEEGYITLLSLPGGLQAKIGRMRSPFGKLNTIHTHDLPQTDRPNVYRHFFGDEGLVETGVALSRILPTPWFSSLDVQVANGESGPLFGRNILNRPLLISHWKNFFELSETQTLELGVSAAAGPTSGHTVTRLSNVGGLDITYRWIPPSQFKAFIWQTELMAAQNKTPGMMNDRLWGGYSFMEAKLNNRWSAGVRVDYTQLPEIANATEMAVAPYVDLWQSEFARWRLEYKHTFGNGRVQASDQAWLQYSVILGLHPPHTF